ncbi:MAG: lipoate--protein ligase family protein [Anaerolineae bacterium]
MRPRWRLLRDGITDAHAHFAMEEAILRMVSEKASPPTLRLRQVRRAVFVGVFQNAWDEVDVDYCRAQGIQIVRRLSGGGAVYHDLGSFCYSAFFLRDLFPQSDEALYPLFARPIIQTCADYGVTARFHGRNDVLVGERKIYGSAQISLYEAFAHSGTFLVNMDFDTMARALTPPRSKFQGKTAQSVKDRVTSLERERGGEVPVDEVMQTFVGHFRDEFGVELVPGEITEEERALAQTLLEEKYATDEWNLGPRHAYRTLVSTRIPDGTLSLAIRMEDGTIREADIQGDILLPNGGALTRLARRWTNLPLSEAHATLAHAEMPEAIREALAALLTEAQREDARHRAAQTESQPNTEG